MVGLNDYENISAADFSVVVDYEQALEGDTVLEVSLESQPRFIHLLKVNPGSVEYLIESD